ncbi:MAG TPA: M20/M25/M40 family metallo-hydrolase, partial [Thermoanaerobaculia bacterium]|nr:M20/M25/M40 family metallo-hydrolase [Thermoanaerobaculia bacterium]
PVRRLVPLLLAGLLCCQAPAAPDSTTLSPAARWLQGYLRLDTTNPPGNEARAAEYLARLLAEHGVESRRFVSPGGRTSLWARLHARSGVDGPALLLLHHMDVVAPGPGWSHPPFGGEVRDGRLFGRGALDDKSLGIAQLAAFLAVAGERRAPARDLVLLASADEERGSAEGTAWLLATHPELFRGVEGVLNEGGSNRQVNGRLLWWGVEAAQKRPLWLEVEARGRGGHGAGFNPHSATHELIRALDRVLARPPRFRVTAAARDYLRALAPLHNARWQPLLTHPERVIGADGPRGDVFMPGMENLFLDTVQVNVLQGAAQINVVPPRAIARIDARLLPDSDGEAFLAELRQALGNEVEVRVLLTSPPAPGSPVDTSLHRTLASVLGREAPLVPFFSPGFTDSRLFRQRGIAAYGFSPFAIEPQDLLGIHGADERIPLRELDRGVERMRAVVRAWAFADRP